MTVAYTKFIRKQKEQQQANTPAPKQNFWGKSLSALGWAGDQLSRVNYGMAGAQLKAQEKYKFSKPMERFKMFFDKDVYKAGYKGLALQEKKTYKDVLEDVAPGDWGSVKVPFTQDTKVTGKGALGLAMDIGLDPTTYLTLGAGSGAKIAAKGGTKTLTKTGSRQLARMSKTVGKEGAESVIEKAAAKSPALAERLIDKGGIKFMGKTIPKTEKLVDPVSKYVRGVTGKFGREGKVLDSPAYIRQQQASRDLSEAGIKRFDEGIDKVTKGLSKQDDIAIGRALHNKNIDELPTRLQSIAKFAKKDWEKRIKAEKGFGFKVAEIEDYAPQIYTNKAKAREVFGDKVGSDIGAHSKRTIIAKNADELVEKAAEVGLVPDFSVRNMMKSRGKASIEGVERSKFLTEVGETYGERRIPVKAERLAAESTKHKTLRSFLADRTKKAGKQLTDKQRKFYTDIYESAKGGFTQQIEKKGLPAIKSDIPTIGRKELGLRELKGVSLPKNIAEHVETMGAQAIKGEEVRKVFKYYDIATDKFKASVTTYFPAFHIRNFLSNIFQNYLDIGAVQALNPKFHKNAVKIMSGKYLDDIIEIGGSSYTVREMRRTMQDSGVLQGMGKMDVGGKIGKKQIGKRAASAIENEARGVNFLANFEKTGDAITASERTKKFLFDYGNLTQSEKTIAKRAFPFWTWTAKNTALQAEQMLKQPGKYATMFKFKRAAESNITDEERKLMPEYMQNKLNIKIGDGQYLSGFGTPMEEFSETLGSPLKKAASMLSPLVKIPIEGGTRIDLFYGKPIEEITNAQNLEALMYFAPQGVKDAIGYDEREKTINDKVIKKATANPWVLWISRQPPMSRFGSTSAQLTDERTSLPGRALRGITGVAERNIDPNTQAYYGGKEYKKEIAEPYMQKGIIKEGSYGSYFVPDNVSMSKEERQEANYMIEILNEKNTDLYKSAAGLEGDYDSPYTSEKKPKKLSKRDKKIALLQQSISGLPAGEQKAAQEAIKYLAMGYSRVPSYAKSKGSSKKAKASYKAVPTVNKRTSYSKKFKAAPKVKMSKKWRS